MLDIFEKKSFIKNTTAILGTFLLFVLSLSTVSGSFLMFLSPLPLMVLRSFEGHLIFWQAFLGTSIAVLLFCPVPAAIMFLSLFLVPTALFVKCTGGNLSNNLGRAISLLVGYFTCLIVLFLGVSESIGINFLNMTQDVFTPLLLTLEGDSLAHELRKILPFFPSMFCVVHLGIFGLNVSIARAIETCLKKTSLEPISLRTATFDKHWDIIFALGLLLQLTGDDFFVLIGKNIACMSCLPMFTLGLQILRIWLKDISKWWFWAFIVLCFMFIWVGLAVVIIGFFNATANLRKKLI